VVEEVEKLRAKLQLCVLERQPEILVGGEVQLIKGSEIIRAR
jgi:hypothetical protein